MRTLSERWQWLGALGAVAVVTLVLGPWLRVQNAAIVSITYLLVVLMVAAASRTANNANPVRIHTPGSSCKGPRCLI